MNRKLVLGRKEDQAFIIATASGELIKVTMGRRKGATTRMLIEADESIKIMREELLGVLAKSKQNLIGSPTNGV